MSSMQVNETAQEDRPQTDKQDNPISLRDILDELHECRLHLAAVEELASRAAHWNR